MVNDSKNKPSTTSDQETQPLEETLLKELLKTAQKEENLDGLSLQKRIEKILDARIELELRILKLIDGGLVGDDNVISDQAVALHKASKDSISELIKVYRLLCDLSTENINLYTPEEAAELKGLRGEIYGRG